MYTNILYFSIRNFTSVNKHEGYMRRCFQLAERGRGNVSPNPMVGAVLVYNDTIIGEGYHEQYGSFHAEVNCLNSVKKENEALIKDSTLYVSLEPCNHQGRTPPCTDSILRNNIQKIVIACKDTSDKVNGAGLQKLQEAGVDIVLGVLEKEAIALNERFFTFHTKQRPYIILKWAQTSNKQISGMHNERLYITNDFTNKLVHKWRSEECAMLVGTNTVLKDNPALTNRLWFGKNPCRIYIDKDLRVDDSFQLQDASVPTVILNTLVEKKEKNREYIKYHEQENFMQQLNNILYKRNIDSLIVEGGATLLQSFIDERNWDEARVITNQNMMKLNGLAAPVLSNEKLYKSEFIGSDQICYYKK